MQETHEPFLLDLPIQHKPGVFFPFRFCPSKLPAIFFTFKHQQQSNPRVFLEQIIKQI